MMILDLEDVLVCVAILTGFLMCVGLLHLMYRWNRIWRVLVILLAVFILSDIAEHLARYWFHDLPRGTNFYRVFLATPVVYGIYAFKQFASEHVHPEMKTVQEEKHEHEHEEKEDMKAVQEA